MLRRGPEEEPITPAALKRGGGYIHIYIYIILYIYMNIIMYIYYIYIYICIYIYIYIRQPTLPGYPAGGNYVLPG